MLKFQFYLIKLLFICYLKSLKQLEDTFCFFYAKYLVVLNIIFYLELEESFESLLSFVLSFIFPTIKTEPENPNNRIQSYKDRSIKKKKIVFLRPPYNIFIVKHINLCKIYLLIFYNYHQILVF